MLKNQLEDIRRSRKTGLNNRKSEITFVPDEDLDKYTLFEKINYESSYLKPKSLNFDRHIFSDVEENKFNAKFSKFLKSLIIKIKDEDSKYLLEYLIRVYSIDTFNSKELIYLLLPFKKFEKQLMQLSRNIKNRFSEMEKYSYQLISKIIVSDRTLFNSYIQYFEFYDYLKEFLDLTIENIIERIKFSKTDYLNEFYKILKILIEKNHQSKALEIYQKSKEYLDLPIFEDLINSCCNKEIQLKNNESKRIKAPVDHTGKHIRSSLMGSFANLEFFIKKAIEQPEIFNHDEFALLKHIICKSEIIKPLIFENTLDLFKELQYKLPLSKFLIKNNQIHNFYKYLDDQSLILLLQEEFKEEFLDSLNEFNHICFIKNMKHKDYSNYFAKIITKCMQFKSFEPEKFMFILNFDEIIHLFTNENPLSESIPSILCSPTYSNTMKGSVFKLMKYFNISMDSFILTLNLQDEFLLSNILKLSIKIDEDLFAKISGIIISKNHRHLLSLLCGFLIKQDIFFKINHLIQFVVENDYFNNIENLVSKYKENLSVNFLYLYFIKTLDFSIYDYLAKTKPDLIFCLSVDNKPDIILEIYSLYGISSVLYNIPLLYEKILPDFFSNSLLQNIDYLQSILIFLIENLSNENALPIIVENIKFLILLRDTAYWMTAKIILIEGLIDRCSLVYVLDYIKSNLDIFSEDDESLFDMVFKKLSNPDIDISLYTKAPVSAEFIDSYIRYNDPPLKPIIPKIVPILIKNQKYSVIKIFQQHYKIMTIYYTNFLVEFEEAFDEIFGIDPDFFLRTLFIRYKPIMMPNLLKIIKTKAIKGLETFDLITKRIDLTDLDVLSTVSSFYLRSFGDEYSDSLANLIILRNLDSEFLMNIFEIFKDRINIISGIILDVIKVIAVSEVNQEIYAFIGTFFNNNSPLCLHSADIFNAMVDSKFYNKFEPIIISFLILFEELFELFLLRIEENLDNEKKLSFLLHILQKCLDNFKFLEINKQEVLNLISRLPSNIGALENIKLSLS